MCLSIIGAGITLGTLVGRLPALTVLEDTAVPVVASIATILEMLAFVFIYGTILYHIRKCNLLAFYLNSLLWISYFY